MSKSRSTAMLLPLGAVQFLGMLVTTGALMGWDKTNPFRYLSDPLLLRLDLPELNLLLGVTTYLFSTVCLMAVLETSLAERQRSGGQSLFGLLPIVGVASHFFLSSQTCASAQEIQGRTEGQRVPAAIVIGLAGAMVLFGVFVVTQTGKPLEPKTSISASEANHAAFLAVTDIGKAQTAYQKTDWDGDGQKEFALFVVHLWRTGRKNKEPVDVNLIPEELAVARVSAFAYRGYSFRNLHCQMTGDDSSQSAPLEEKTNLRELDYSKEWALLAAPELATQEDEMNKSLQFIALSDGRIFARQHQPDTIRCIPFEFEKQWSLISSSADVSKLQKL